MKSWFDFLLGSLVLLISLMVFGGCTSEESSQNQKTSSDAMNAEKGTFGYDVQFLKQYTEVAILTGKDSLGKVLVTPQMQGRVMTSTLQGNTGKSLGWVNHALIASGETKERFTPYGGEDRFWIGPEGGQYSVFINPGMDMVFENWYVPAGFNTEPWKLVLKSDSTVTVEKDLRLTNYSNTKFELNVNRTIRMFDTAQSESLLSIQIPEGIKKVAYESENTIRNIGNNTWTRKGGAISIWILSMFIPDPGITVVVPYKKGPESELGPIVSTDYFGDISSERLRIDEGAVYFKIDGKKRRKLGVSPRRARPVAGSYDETNNMLTIIKYSFPENSTDYMNQLWKQQEEPYGGNVVFAYNDGPLEDGSQLGPFYELESSSPAAFLGPEETLTHRHQVFHFAGDTQALSRISEEILGVGLSEIIAAF